MAHKKGKRTLITALSILAVLLIVIGVVALVKAHNAKKDPYVQQATNSSTNSSTPNNTSTNNNSSTATPDDSDANSTHTANNASNQTTPDPSTVNSITIAPMSIVVSYVKGVGAFEYQVLRATNGTQYVEFRSADLVGTKCTNDEGTFASILANPTDDEKATLSKTTTVDGTVYGLSLADTTCTSDTAKLQKYQQSFSDAFSLLKKSS